MNPKLFWLITAILLAIVHRAEAQQPTTVPRIGFLAPGSPSSDLPRVDPFRQGLRELGYVEGKNILVEYRYAEGKLDKISSIVTELIQLSVAVIVLSGTPAAQVARGATSAVPIVMGTSADPVSTGLVASLARPGGNITGLSTLGSDLGGKRLELVKELLPRVSRIAVLSNPNNQSVPGLLKETENAARTLGVQAVFVEARTPAEFEKAFAAAKRQGSALVVVPDPMLFDQRKRLAALAVENRLPAVAEWVEFSEAGGLISYGPSFSDMFRRAAFFVHKILQGAKPEELPVEQPKKFELVINLSTAKQMSLTIPPNVLARADRVIR